MLNVASVFSTLHFSDRLAAGDASPSSWRFEILQISSRQHSGKRFETPGERLDFSCDQYYCIDSVASIGIEISGLRNMYILAELFIPQKRRSCNCFKMDFSSIKSSLHRDSSAPETSLPFDRLLGSNLGENVTKISAQSSKKRVDYKYRYSTALSGKGRRTTR